MKRLATTTGIALTVLASAVAAQNNGHAHIGHAADGFRGTPDGVGLLPAAQMEAEVAVQHAGLAARGGGLDAMKRHIGHAMHALNSETAERGPGKGYGLIRAAEGAARHITLAAGADAASDNLKRHAEHVSAAATTAAENATRALDLGRRIMMSDDEGAVTEMVAEMVAMLDAVANGKDVDGNGRVGWGGGEGGLAQAATHLGLLKRGEGM